MVLIGVMTYNDYMQKNSSQLCYESFALMSNAIQQ